MSGSRRRLRKAPSCARIRYFVWITPDGSPGPSGEGGFKAEPGRYHLYVSHACPWSHPTVMFRKLKKLEAVIPMSVVHPYMTDKGWKFEPYPGATKDLANGTDYLCKVYKLARDRHIGIVQVPVLSAGDHRQ
jgi:putative glutathione S-transferase